MTEDETCPLIKRRCFRADYFKDRCSSNPTFDDACKCIDEIDRKRAHLENELSYYDDFIESVLKRLSTENEPENSGH